MQSAAPLVRRRELIAGGAVALVALSQDVGAATQPASSIGDYVDVSGSRIYYEIHGEQTSEPPIVLLHGGMLAIDTSFGLDLLPRLARSRRVIALESQGHGHTADRPGALSADRLVADSIAVLDSLNIQRADLLGHSMGSLIAIEVALRRPQLVRNLVALSASFNNDGMLPELVEMQRNPGATPPASLIPLLPTAAELSGWADHYQRVAPNPSAFQGLPARLHAMSAAWQGWSPEQLGSIRSPTLLAIGDRDFIRPAHAAEMSAMIPDSRLAVLPGTTHMSILRRGEWIDSMLRARLSDK